MSNLSNISTALTTTLKDSDLHGVTTEFSEIFLDTFLAEGVLKDIPIINTIISLGKTGIKINDTLFLKKILYFISQVNDVPAEEREKVINEIDKSKSYRIKIGEKLLYIVDKCDDHEKAEIIGNLFKAFLKRQIDYDDFLRCTQVIEKCLIDELQWFIFTEYNEYTIESHSEYLSWGLLEFAPFQIDIQERNYGEDDKSTYELSGGYLTLVVSKAGKIIREYLKAYSKEDKYNSISKMTNIEVQHHIDVIILNYLGKENVEKFEKATFKTLAEMTINENLTRDEFIISAGRIMSHHIRGIKRYDNYINKYIKKLSESGKNYDASRWIEFSTGYKKDYDYLDFDTGEFIGEL